MSLIIDDHPNKAKIIKMIAARISGVDPEEYSISDEAYKLLGNIPYRNLIKPLVIYDRKNKLTWRQISIKYNVSIKIVRGIYGC